MVCGKMGFECSEFAVFMKIGSGIPEEMEGRTRALRAINPDRMIGNV